MGGSPIEPVAIVGMACRLPGGVDSASSLWRMLIEKKSAQTPRVPKSRFDIDAYYHENLERPGSFNVLGGYFLDGPAENFDPSFFGISPIEAMWMDPQQRRILEVTYECFESAGLTLEDISNTNTAVYIGSFTADYQQMAFKETDFRHSYAATGVDPGIISNRVGNVFNLRGPSFTINTACSSSVYAIHNACNALRSRDCVAALAGGVNLILTVDQHMNTAKLGVLSPTSTCHTFDASADGYGRGEGAGVLYLKLLSDAIRDNDPIRGVIRSSSVNTNGKVTGMGITYPSIEGQERVMRAAYERANLDPSQTIYLEMHGTGTPTGDPIEAKAVSNAMNDTRSKYAPLFVGAVKPNIGHSEAASGIFSVMKAAMMTETGVIPGVYGFQRLNPAIKEESWNIKVHAETKPWPENSLIRRASVNSFGYGGTNGHVIVEGVNSLYPSYRHGKIKKESLYDKSTSKPFLVTFSAHDKATLVRNIESHSKVAQDYYLIDLVYTLNSRRSRFNQRAFAVVSECHGNFSLPSFKIGSTSRTIPQLAFIFTGQGAQWPRMGAEAMKVFPSFLRTIRALDCILQSLNPPPSWRMEDVLLAPAETSRLRDAEISQPLCTGVQIALVDLMLEWGILPSVVVGHSSGEIAAAYSAGRISASEAIIAAFCRGYTVQHNAVSGTMLAAGLGVEDISKYIPDVSDVVVACINSPKSVTLSGSVTSIQEVKAQLTADGVFARELNTGMAYHSPHMDVVVPEYEQLYLTFVSQLHDSALDKRCPRIRMISSVTGREIHEDSLSIRYWSDNLRGQVKFDQAVTEMLVSDGLETPKYAIEIGPHSALAGPLKQIWQSLGIKGFGYTPTFVRNTDSALQLFNLAGELFLLGALVDLDLVNNTNAINAVNSTPELLVDLPPYQWDYKKKYWAEPSASMEQRHKKFMRHDLLGSRIPGLSEPVWGNKLRHKDIPWLIDHSLGGSTVFPAAGYLSMAIEALRQILKAQDFQYKGMRFRDVSFKLAMIIPDTDDGLQVQLRLQPVHKSSTRLESVWYLFTIESYTDGRWTAHSEGKIAANPMLRAQTSANKPPAFLDKLTQHSRSTRWYSSFSRVGFNYGPSFQGLNNIMATKGFHGAAADVDLSIESGLMTGESDYILHPTCIDACLQLMIISINEGIYTSMQFGSVPINIEEASIWFPETDITSKGKAVAWSKGSGRYAINSAQLKGESGYIILDIRGLKSVTYEAAVPPQANIVTNDPKPYMETIWKPDISRLEPDQLCRGFGHAALAATGLEILIELVDLLNHKASPKNILLLGQHPEAFVKSLLDIMPSTTSFTIFSDSLEHAEDPGRVPLYDNRVIVKSIPDFSSLDSAQFEPASQDLVIVNKAITNLAIDDMVPLTQRWRSEGGYIIYHTDGEFGDALQTALSTYSYPPRVLRFNLGENTVIASYSEETHLNGEVARQDATILSLNKRTTLMENVTNQNFEHQLRLVAKELGAFDPGADRTLIIDDLEGATLLTLNGSSFESLKKVLCSGTPTVWVTAGVNEGKRTGGSLAVGLIRAILSEQANAKIAILDVDVEEDVENVMNAIFDTIRKLENVNSDTETEMWLHKGRIHISRIVYNTRLSDLLSNSPKPNNTLLTTTKALEGTVVSGQLVFNELSRMEETQLAPDEVEVQVSVSEIDPADFQSRSQKVRIVVGQVVAIGKSLNNLLLGQRVVAYTNKVFSTRMRVSRSSICPIDMCGEDVVASLPRICAVWNAVVRASKAQNGQHILLLPAPTSFVQAFISLSKTVGYTYTLVVDNTEDETHYLAQGIPLSDIIRVSTTEIPSIITELIRDKGLSSVISHEFSPISQEVWRYVPARAIFVLLDGNIQEPPDILPFTRGATFLSTSIDMLYTHDEDALGHVLEGAISHLKGDIETFERRIDKCSVGSLSLAASASTVLTSMNSAVLTYQYGQDFIKVRNSTEVRFSSEASYVLVGCLGGLGRSLTVWMMARGAKHFAFLSRSGIDKPEAAQLVRSLRKDGASVTIYRADATNEDEVMKVIAQESSERPIRGVVHAAMVLNDSLFENMTYDQYQDTIAPKVKVAENLHRGLQGQSLDFFLMMSSLSATIGNPGQSNYCAGNSYLDSLARSRNLQGLPAVSIVLPAILDVGYVGEHHELEAILRRRGIVGISEVEMLRGFEAAIMQQSSAGVVEAVIQDSQIILGLEASSVAGAFSSAATADTFWFQTPRFRHLRASVEAIMAPNGTKGKSAMGPRSGNSAVGDIKAAISGGPEYVLYVISDHLAKRLSSILAIDVDDMALEGPSVASFGLDSMIGAEFRNWLFKEFDFEVSFPVLLAPDLSIKDLSIRIGKSLGVIETNIDR